MIRTADPYIFAEEMRDGYVRYRKLDPKTGEVIRRWEQRGVCPCDGTCMEGAHPGDPAWNAKDQRLDVPNMPEVECDPCTTVPLLTFAELEV